MERNPRAPVLRLSASAGDGTQGGGPDVQFRAFHGEQLLELLHQRVLGLGQDLDQGGLIQFIERRDHRQAADQFRNETELDQILRFRFAKQFAHATLGLRAHRRGETDAGLFRSVANDFFQPVKRATYDEQDVRRIHLDEVLVRMLAAALGRYRGDRALDQLEQSLLDALAGYVTGNGGVIRLA